MCRRATHPAIPSRSGRDSASAIPGASAIMRGSRITASTLFGFCPMVSRRRDTRILKQDEFVYMLKGEFVLVTDAGCETVGPGTYIGFPAGTGDGHHFLNLTQKDAIFLVIGDRTAGDEVTYPDIDLELKAGPMA